MSQLASYVQRYGPLAGPRLYHAVRSRAALMGVNRRRRATIARLTGHATERAGRSPRGESTGLLPFAAADQALA